jgi:serine/threonine protein kinase
VKHTFIRALFRLSGLSGCYPESLVMRDIVLDTRAPIAAGQFGDVWKEEVQGHFIAVKAVRVYVKSDVDKVVKVRLILFGLLSLSLLKFSCNQAFSREAVTWAQLSHPNILPFYGIYQLNENCSRPCFISPWMENGTITQFLERRPDANRVALVN